MLVFSNETGAITTAATLTSDDTSTCDTLVEMAPHAKRRRSDIVPVEMKFLAHVADTCMQKFSPTYFATGIAEECAELGVELKRFEFAPTKETYFRVLSEAGDVLWYVAALCKAERSIVK